MAVDITKLKENDLLSALGDGEWVIAMPEGYTDLHLSAQWRDELLAWAGTRFVRWVLSGVRYEITYDYDPPWDHSGEALQRYADPLILRTLHDTLAVWMENEYTGQWIATFMSGFGKRWETYGDVVEEQVRERLAALFRTQYAAQFATQPDDFEVAIWDDADLVIINLEQALLMVVGRISTTEVWKRFESLTYQQLAAERAARYARMCAQAEQFWRTYFVDLQQVRIEQPQFKKLQLAERLSEHLLDADPDVVAAIAEVGLPGDFSNSVSAHIRALAASALVG